MRRKIVLSLLLLVGGSAAGGLVAEIQVRATTAELGRLIKLHQIEELRRDLVIAVQTVQSDLFAVNTGLGRKADAITDTVFRLESTAARCSSCHHEEVIASRIGKVNQLIGRYEEELSYYITASADKRRRDRLLLEASALGGEILQLTEQMSLQASRSLEQHTAAAMDRITSVRLILSLTALLSLLVAIAVAAHLTAAVSRPIDQLLQATRAIASGDLGHKISVQRRDEFGELAATFNAMSEALGSGYAQLQAKVEERDRAQEALLRSEERYALAARGANDGLWDWDLESNKVFLSTRWKEMLGCAEDDIGDRPEDWLGRVHPDDRASLETKIAAHIKGATPHLESEHRIRHADDSYLWVVCRGAAVRNVTGVAYRLAGSQTDITPRKRAEEQLLYDAFHDALTGLPNRALFLDRLAQVIRASARSGDVYAVLFLDVDRFKVVNDTLGHAVGDLLLVEVGERIARCVRPVDTVARLGGDEFGILLQHVGGPPEAIQVAERIQKELSTACLIEGNEVSAKASIGIALRSERYETPEQVLRDADIAMYQAKAKGKACHEAFDAQMHGSVLERLQLETDLRRALERQDEFHLHYQPIVELATARLVGFEALARWNRPGRGRVPPSDFIPLAEESGMILPIGEMFVRRACEQLRSWQTSGPAFAPLRVSLNISPRQFAQPDVVERLARSMAEAGVRPDHVALEVTENVIMRDVEESAAKLAQLRDMGLQIFVDDFGTGYSSLSYLHRFPVTGVKIDRSFVASLGTQGGSDALIRAIVSIADSLRLVVVAEGIEEMAHYVKLRELRCGFGQGHYFGRAMAPAEAAAWATARVSRAIAG